MGTMLYLLRVAPEQLALNGDALVALILSAARSDEPGVLDRTADIDTAWQWLEPLLTGGDAPDTEPSTLPIYGSRTVEVDGSAPVCVLEPAEVQIAADFLAAADFDDLWARHRPAVEEGFGSPLPDEARDELRGYVTDLRRLYSAAAANGDAMAKWFAF